MRKSALVTAVAILAVSGAIVATKSLVAPISATAQHHAVVEPTHVTTQATTSKMMAIVPAPVIDTTAAFFVGTGDASGGAWVKP